MKQNLAEKQLREKEAIFREIDEGIIALDHQGFIKDINPAAIAILRGQSNLSLGKHFADCIQSVAISELLTKSIKIQESLSSIISFKDGNGATMSVEVHSIPMLSDDNLDIKFLLRLSDVSKLRKLETIRRDFVANVSHELKTPITNIRGFVETLLSSSTISKSERQHFLKIIGRHANRLEAIIDDLLTLAHLEDNEEFDKNRTLDFKLADINDSIELAISNCLVQATLKEIKIEFSRTAKVVSLLKESLFEQALTNIVENAVKYSPSKSSILISMIIGEGFARVVIEDSGPGVAADQVERVFERFYRTDRARSRSVGGTGLGLAIAKHIALLHKGRIGVDSTLGLGSRFWIEIPIVTNEHLTSDLIEN